MFVLVGTLRSRGLCNSGLRLFRGALASTARCQSSRDIGNMIDEENDGTANHAPFTPAVTSEEEESETEDEDDGL